MVTVPYNARGTNQEGTRGRVECKVTGRYYDLGSLNVILQFGEGKASSQ
jgi:hypothetical protein